jgi:YfiR/HmsC-like
LLAWLFMAGSLATASPSATLAAQSIIDSRAGSIGGTVDRLLGGLISYFRWPHLAPGAPLNVCTVGSPALTIAARPTPPGGTPAITHRDATVGSVLGGQSCDVLYIGRLPETEMRRLIAGLRNRAVLTVSDADPACLSGAAICLFRQSGGVGYSLNLDAVARSRLAIDPRILQRGSAARSQP